MSAERTAETARENQSRREISRIVAGGYEDYQRVRLATMNRIRDIIRKLNEGISFDEVEEKKDEKTFDRAYQDANLGATLSKMLAEGRISETLYDHIMDTMGLAEDAQKLEAKHARNMTKFITGEPIWEEFLVHVRGIGPVIATQLIKEYGYGERYDTISNMWGNSGLSVTQEGLAPTKAKGEKAGFDPDKRTLSAYKIGELFIKHNSPIYRDVYDKTKARELVRMEDETDEHRPKSRMHAHNRARRKMVKLFLSHYWEAGRTIMGLPTRTPYAEGYLGHTSIIHYDEVIKSNTKAKAAKATTAEATS